MWNNRIIIVNRSDVLKLNPGGEETYYLFIYCAKVPIHLPVSQQIWDRSDGVDVYIAIWKQSVNERIIGMNSLLGEIESKLQYVYES